MDLIKLLRIPVVELIARGFTQEQINLLINLARRLGRQARL